jgi:hypothetical protein
MLSLHLKDIHEQKYLYSSLRRALSSNIFWATACASCTGTCLFDNNYNVCTV